MLRNVFAGLLSAVVLASPMAASANTILTYTGQTYASVSGGFDTTQNVTMSITLASALDSDLSLANVTPLSFVFNDGLDTITEANSFYQNFRFTTDATGKIVNWDISAESKTSDYSYNSISSSNKPGPFGTFNRTDSVYQFSCPAPLESDNLCHAGTQIDGHASTSNSIAGTFTVSAQAVPEPMSALLLLTGVAALAPVSRRFRAQ